MLSINELWNIIFYIVCLSVITRLVKIENRARRYNNDFENNLYVLYLTIL